MSTDELIIEIKNGNTEAKTELWERVRKWVACICRRYMAYSERLGYDLDDLINTSWLGVERAIRTYDTTKGRSFTSYLTYHVQNVIRDLLGLRGQSKIITISLDEPISSDDDIDGMTRLDLVEDKSAADAFDLAEKSDVYKWLWDRVAELEDNKSFVLREFYSRGSTLPEIASKLSVTTQQAIQLKNGAMRDIRKNKALRYITDYAHRDN